MPIVRTRLKESTVKRIDLKTEDIEKEVKLGKLETNIAVSDIKELQGEQKALIFEYKYNVSYPLAEPKDKKIGEVVVIGEIVYIDEEKALKDIVAGWKKDKKIDQKLLTNLLNTGMVDAQVEAIEQSKKVGLPSPVPLIRFKEEK